jgi:hypothetical protein
MTAMRAPHIKHVALIVCCASVACDSPTKPLTGCLGDVPIEISSSSAATPQLRFNWSPPCGITTLTVSTVPAPGASPVQVWALDAAEQTPVGPSITYGVTPRGAIAQHVALPLVNGLTYRVSVAYVIGGDGIAASGDKLFTF